VACMAGRGRAIGVDRRTTSPTGTRSSHASLSRLWRRDEAANCETRPKSRTEVLGLSKLSPVSRHAESLSNGTVSEPSEIRSRKSSAHATEAEAAV